MTEDQINQLIAKFTEEDRDIGTAGLCGVFAMALYNFLTKRKIPAQLYLICICDKYGRPFEVDDSYIWKHVLVKVGNSFFDIDGRVQLDHVIANYCWTAAWGKLNGCAIPVSYATLIKELRSIRSSAFDRNYLNKWKKELNAA